MKPDGSFTFGPKGHPTDENLANAKRNLCQTDIVMLKEQLPQSVWMAAALFRLRLPPRNTKAARWLGRRKAGAGELSPAVVDEIKRANARDIELYNFARLVHRRQYRTMSKLGLWTVATGERRRVHAVPHSKSGKDAVSTKGTGAMQAKGQLQTAVQIASAGSVTRVTILGLVQSARRVVAARISELAEFACRPNVVVALYVIEGGSIDDTREILMKLRETATCQDGTPAFDTFEVRPSH